MAPLVLHQFVPVAYTEPVLHRTRALVALDGKIPPVPLLFALRAVEMARAQTLTPVHVATAGKVLRLVLRARFLSAPMVVVGMERVRIQILALAIVYGPVLLAVPPCVRTIRVRMEALVRVPISALALPVGLGLIARLRCAPQHVKTEARALTRMFARVPPVGLDQLALNRCAFPPAKTEECAVNLTLATVMGQDTVAPLAQHLCVRQVAKTMDNALHLRYAIAQALVIQAQLVQLLCALLDARMVVLAQLPKRVRVLLAGPETIVPHQFVTLFTLVKTEDSADHSQIRAHVLLTILDPPAKHLYAHLNVRILATAWPHKFALAHQIIQALFAQYLFALSLVSILVHA